MINNVQGPGIKVQRGNRAHIQLCEFLECTIGIQVVSADPLINMNKVMKSSECGIHVLTKNSLQAEAIIKYNWVEKNFGEGIILEGDQNFSRVEKNHHISYNKKAGVKCCNQSSGKVLNN